MTSEWKETTLEDCTSLLGDGLHGTPQYAQNGEYAFINGNNLVNGRIIIKSDTKRVDRTQYEKYKKELCDRTIMVSINGTLGNVALYNGEKIILGKSACYFNVSKSVDKDFIRYVVSSPVFRTYLETNATGTTIKNISLKQMREYSFFIPDYETQKRISAFLRAIDDRISVNTAINENLEQQAQAIFKSWFVDFEPFGGVMPDDWNTGNLGSFVTIKRGGSPRPIQNYLSETGYRWLKISDVTSLNSPFILDIKEHIIESGLKKTVFLKQGALVLSNSATPGIPKILDVDSCIHDGWLYFPESKLSNEYLYLLFKFIRKDLVALGNGSVFTNLKTDILKQYKISLPSESVLNDFQTVISPIFETMRNLARENKSLAALRDTLLPKLMNGEIDVSQVKINNNPILNTIGV